MGFRQKSTHISRLTRWHEKPPNRSKSFSQFWDYSEIDSIFRSWRKNPPAVYITGAKDTMSKSKHGKEKELHKFSTFFPRKMPLNFLFFIYVCSEKITWRHRRTTKRRRKSTTLSSTKKRDGKGNKSWLKQKIRGGERRIAASASKARTTSEAAAEKGGAKYFLSFAPFLLLSRHFRIFSGLYLPPPPFPLPKANRHQAAQKLPGKMDLSFPAEKERLCIETWEAWNDSRSCCTAITILIYPR